MGALTPPSAGRLRGSMIAAFCALILVFDGYDVSVFATTIPALLQYEPWGLNAAELGFIASLALIGMLGLKLMLMASSGWFSVCMAVCAFAPTATVFGVFRFLAGLGLGASCPLPSRWPWSLPRKPGATWSTWCSPPASWWAHSSRRCSAS
jgi:MFS transporter, AAHS family, benzoate transport protein